jgi:hypothetical protein
MIQGRPQVVDAIPQDKAQVVRNRIDLCDAETTANPASVADCLKRFFRVGLLDDGIWFTFEPNTSFCIEGLKMFTCPRKL